MGNYPMRIRWQVHRYLLKQSMSFYQDEFAGRIATKLMQTALAVRECVIKLIDVLNYVVVYFLGMLFIVGSADWRLAVPLVVWLVCYVAAAALLHPAARQGRRGAGRCALDDDRPRRRQLHQHPDGEAVLACAARGLLSPGKAWTSSWTRSTARCGWSPCCSASLYVLNSLLLFSVTALSIWLWLGQAVTIGAVAVVIGLVLQAWGMSQWIMWEMSGLFENIGTVQDGITSISLPRLVEDKPGAKDIVVPQGRDRLRPHRLPLRQGARASSRTCR